MANGIWRNNSFSTAPLTPARPALSQLFSRPVIHMAFSRALVLATLALAARSAQALTCPATGAATAITCYDNSSGSMTSTSVPAGGACFTFVFECSTPLVTLQLCTQAQSGKAVTSYGSFTDMGSDCATTATGVNAVTDGNGWTVCTTSNCNAAVSAAAGVSAAVPLALAAAAAAAAALL